MFFSYLKADFLKTKHLSIRTSHLFIPIVTALIFIAYYSYTPWGDYAKVDIYYQVLGMALPFLIGLFCAILSEQEQSAGNFQTMLMSAKKVIPFLSKLLLLLLFCAGALFMASLIFGAAFQFGLHGRAVGMEFYLLAALVMFGSSIPMYLLHLYLSFRLNKGVSIGLGIVESVLSALFLTGLGDSIWKYVPSAWPARMVTTFLRAYNGAIFGFDSESNDNTIITHIKNIRNKLQNCVLRYTLSPQYKSSFLQKILIPPEILVLISALLGMLLIIIVIAISFGKALNKKLSTLILVANKVQQQELDFKITTSGIKEIDTILHSMDNMRAALKDSLERQWQIEQEKNRQMSALAHDLKTPLTLVRGNAELLLESDLSEMQKKFTEYIESSSLQMQNYVQTLIEVTKSWQGYQFRPQKLVCDVLFQEVEQQLKGLCMVHHLTPVWECHYTINEISADHDLFIRAIVNIISNAAERTPLGEKIVFSVSEENNLLLFTVTDSGCGFSPDALKHGTEQFYMDDTSRTSKTHFGIGLYAASSIIQKHGGQLILDNSKETGGAKVTIKIPCQT